MAGGGMERLSPIIKSSSVRRLSLDLCQKLGSQLLSPNLVQSSVQNTKQIRKSSISATSTKEPFFSSHHQGGIKAINSKGQPNHTPTGQQGYLPRRRCSDSFSHFYTTKSPGNANHEHSPLRINHTQANARRKSLTPLNCHHAQNLGHHSPILAEALKLGICPIPPSPPFDENDNDKNDTGTRLTFPDHDKENNNNAKNNSKNNNPNPKEGQKSSEVVYNVIPPTPSAKVKKSHLNLNQNLNLNECRNVLNVERDWSGSGGSSGSSHSSDEEGKVFRSPDNEKRRRTSVARLGNNVNVSSRRKSSSTRYDFDDEFLKFVLIRSKLHLIPENVLGRGSFGTVVAGTYKGQPVAVKVIKTKSGKTLESMKGEQNALSLPPHPHIAKHIEILQVQPEKSLVVLELLLKGNLLALINDPEVTLDLSKVIQISLEISSALDFCHSHGILHLDVKPQNVLLDSQGVSKLSDFGNSKRIADLKSDKDFTKLDGTVAYRAPELFRGACPTTKSDVFSLGISMWQMLTREMPYMAETEHSVIYKVVAQNLRPKAVCSFHASFTTPNKNQNLNILLKEFVSIYETCWDGQPDKRYSMNTVFDKLFQLRTKFSPSGSSPSM